MDSIGDETKYTSCVAGWGSHSHKSVQVHNAANQAARQLTDFLMLGWGLGFENKDMFHEQSESRLPDLRGWAARARARWAVAPPRRHLVSISPGLRPDLIKANCFLRLFSIVLNRNTSTCEMKWARTVTWSTSSCRQSNRPNPRVPRRLLTHLSNVSRSQTLRQFKPRFQFASLHSTVRKLSLISASFVCGSSWLIQIDGARASWHCGMAAPFLLP